MGWAWVSIRRSYPRCSGPQAITGYVWEESVGAVFRRDTVHVTEDGAQVLTDNPPWGSR
jgi:hypothetical protein